MPGFEVIKKLPSFVWLSPAASIGSDVKYTVDLITSPGCCVLMNNDKVRIVAVTILALLLLVLLCIVVPTAIARAGVYSQLDVLVDVLGVAGAAVRSRRGQPSQSILSADICTSECRSSF